MSSSVGEKILEVFGLERRDEGDQKWKAVMMFYDDKNLDFITHLDDEDISNVTRLETMAHIWETELGSKAIGKMIRQNVKIYKTAKVPKDRLNRKEFFQSVAEESTLIEEEKEKRLKKLLAGLR